MTSLLGCLSEFGIMDADRTWSAEQFVGAIVDRDPNAVKGLVCMDRHANLFH
jgi:hypothetical protein